MSYTEFKKEHDFLITELIFNDTNKGIAIVERLENLEEVNPKHVKKLWSNL